jgi:hypothetical protein
VLPATHDPLVRYSGVKVINLYSSEFFEFSFSQVGWSFFDLVHDPSVLSETSILIIVQYFFTRNVFLYFAINFYSIVLFFEVVQ